MISRGVCQPQLLRSWDLLEKQLMEDLVLEAYILLAQCHRMGTSEKILVGTVLQQKWPALTG